MTTATDSGLWTKAEREHGAVLAGRFDYQDDTLSGHVLAADRTVSRLLSALEEAQWFIHRIRTGQEINMTHAKTVELANKALLDSLK